MIKATTQISEVGKIWSWSTSHVGETT